MPSGIERQIEMVLKSGLFDREFYLETYNDVDAVLIDPVTHYVINGYKEGRYPFPCANKEVMNIIKECASKNFNFFVFFNELKDKNIEQYLQLKILIGIDRKNYYLIKNSELFDPNYYLQLNNDVAKENINPILHYLQIGAEEKRICSLKMWPLFNEAGEAARQLSLLNWERYYKHTQSTSLDDTNRRLVQECGSHSVINIETIKKIIASSSIKIVSFDIFDTLLCRPAFAPEDVINFTGKVLLDKHGIKNFADMRLNIEKIACDLLANIDEIYEAIRKYHKIPLDTINLMKNAELEIESRLLNRREEIYDIYEYARLLGKRIIAVSDMYLPGEFLERILKKNGYNDIAMVYVSNECGFRKTSGLHKYVLEREGAGPLEVAHIGDDIVSDYYEPQKLGMSAIFYPRARDLIYWRTLIGKSFKSPEDLGTRLVLGFALNETSKGFIQSDHFTDYFVDWEEFVKLGVLPVLLGIALYILNNREIQRGYGQVLFAGRDGHQPMKAYEILRKAVGGLSARYIYAGRKAYNYLGCQSIWDQICEHDADMRQRPVKIKFADYIKAAVGDKALRDQIFEVLGIDCSTEFPGPGNPLIAKLLAMPCVNEWFERRRREAVDYYKSQCLENCPREIVFDCGYAGSISAKLTPVIGKPLDKIYLYSTQKNAENDKRFGTKTFQILNGAHIPPMGVNLVYEELFAPLEGGCKGFVDGVPILEKCVFSASMSKKFEKMDKIFADLAGKFAALFGDLCKFITVNDFRTLQSMLVSSLLSPEHKVWECFIFCVNSYLASIKPPVFVCNYH